MARTRDYKAEYAARSRRAKTAGFESYTDQRQLRAKASVLIPGRSSAAVSQRDTFALEMRAGRERARAGVPEAWTDLLIDPTWGAVDLAELQAGLGPEAWQQLEGLMQRAFDESSGGGKSGDISVGLLDDINLFLAEHDISLREWWAELYGQAA